MKNYIKFQISLIIIPFALESISIYAQQNGYIKFYTDYNKNKVNIVTEIDEIIDGKDVSISPDHFIASKKELTIPMKPGTHDIKLSFTRLNNLVVKENAITFISIHEISGTNKYNLNVSFGENQLPVKVNTKEDIGILTKALSDNDWGTRKFAIIAFDNLTQEVDENIIQSIRLIATNDRYEAVRSEAVNFLKNKKRPNSSEPFYFTTFTEMGFWKWTDNKLDPAFYANSSGYHISTTTTGESSYWLKYLLMDKGFFGYNPKNLHNYSIELDCKWVEGTENAPYGIIIGTSNEKNDYNPIVTSFYVCCISKSGASGVIEYINNQSGGSPVNWNNNALASIQNHETNRLKLEIKGKMINFYVNDILIGSFNANADYLNECIGLGVFNKADVCFSRLAIYKSD